MKIAFLALIAAALPLLAQAEEPKASPASQAAPTPSVEQKADDRPVETRQPWWKHRVPKPVGDRTIVRTPAMPAAKATAKPAPEEKAQPVQARETAKTKAQAKGQPKAQSMAEPTPGAEAEEAPKRKAGFFGALGRVFGGDNKEPLPGRSAVRRALPAPRSVTGKKPEAAAKPESAVAAAAKKAPATPSSSAPEKKKTSNETPAVASAPATPDARKSSTKASATVSAPSASTLPPKPEVNEEMALPGDTALPQIAPAPPVPKPEPEFNRKNYLETKQQAAQDPKIAELGRKLEAATSGEAHKTAARRYTKALFKKMNELDSSQPDWYRRMEAATMRRIDSGKPISAE